MTELIAEIFSKIFNGNVALATVLVSMLPIMELKGGIPFGMSSAFWGARALSRTKAFWLAYLGCSIVVVALYFLFVPIMKFFRKTKAFKGLATFIEKRIKKQTDKMQDDGKVQQGVNSGQETLSQTDNLSAETQPKEKATLKSKLIKMLGVFIFTAIPLPLTGVWMGTCIAVMVGLNFFETLVAVQLGNLIAGFIISTICVAFPGFTHILLYVFLILIAIVIIYEIIKHVIFKNKNKQNK